jgi:serine/threonine protein kinase
MRRLPQRFGSYVLVQLLAQDAMSSLYVALSGTQGSPRPCVVKIAPEGYRQRFRDEVDVAKQLSHPNLVREFDWGQVDGEVYVTMDFVDGKDLRAIWNRCAKSRTRIPLAFALVTMRDLARALDYAHKLTDVNLVHRNVCPHNILVSYAGEIRLADFSLALSTFKAEKTVPGFTYGNPNYMSPEQARGAPLDHRTDLYSVGIVLWELLTGQHLFAWDATPPTPLGAQDSRELLVRLRNPIVPEPASFAPWISPELNSLVMRALRPDRDERYQACDELQSDLDRVLGSSLWPGSVSDFLHTLYGGDIEKERRQRERVMQDGAAMLPISGQSRTGVVAAKIESPKARDPSGPSRIRTGTDIFVSYAHEDRAMARALADVFARQGWSVWWDPDITLGRLYDEEIERAIDSATCIVVLWSEPAVASRWVRAEAHAGLERGVLVPVLLEHVRVPLAFRALQAAVLVGWDREGDHVELAKVVRHIGALVEGARASTPIEGPN